MDIPTALRQFFSEGCGGVDISYTWIPEENTANADSLRRIFGKTKAEVWGGGPFCIASDLKEWRRNVEAWARESWVADYPEELAMWMNALPIMELANGDYLGLDLRSGCDNPPVLYLSHDDNSQILSTCFTDFLTHWAGVCYVGPEIWMLEPFLSTENLLDSTMANALELKILCEGRSA